MTTNWTRKEDDELKGLSPFFFTFSFVSDVSLELVSKSSIPVETTTDDWHDY